MSFYPGITLKHKIHYLRQLVRQFPSFGLGLTTKERLQAYLSRFGVDNEYCSICIDLAVLNEMIVYVKKTNSYKASDIWNLRGKSTNEKLETLLDIESRYLKLTLPGLCVYPRISLDRKLYYLREVVIYLSIFDEPITKEGILAFCNLSYGLDKDYCGIVLDLAVLKEIIIYKKWSKTYKPGYVIP